MLHHEVCGTVEDYHPDYLPLPNTELLNDLALEIRDLLFAMSYDTPADFSRNHVKSCSEVVSRCIAIADELVNVESYWNRHII